MDIKIPIMKWTQVGGDMNPGSSGGIIAQADGTYIEIREIQPTRDCVGDNEAAEIGFPFWSREGYYDLADLNPDNKDVQSALQCCGLDLNEVGLDHKAMAIAECLLSYGYCVDEGTVGWAKDVIPDRVKWWGSHRPRGWRYIADEDKDFRQMVREHTRRNR